jgi:hypothetical protein
VIYHLVLFAALYLLGVTVGWAAGYAVGRASALRERDEEQGR